MKVTIKDIAKRAGVSHPTVSRALRNDPQISKATTERIQKLAKEMGYHPDPALTALSAYRSSVKPTYQLEKLAVLCTSDRIDRLPEHIQEQVLGIQNRSQELGFEAEIFPVGESEKEQGQLGKILYHRGIRGVIVTALPWQIRAFPWEKFCAVGIGENAEPLGIHYVHGDHDHAITVTYEKLRGHGYQNIGYCNMASSEKRNRYLFYGSYLKQRALEGLEIKLPLLYPPGDYHSLLSWLEHEKFDALMIDDVELFNFLTHSGIQIPEELGVAGLGASVKENNRSQLASYVLERQRLGRRAVDFMQSMIHKNEVGMPAPAARYVLSTRGYWSEGTTLRTK
ncbi:LacI family DNA-binding transcriptional regulator [Kiritimatiellaeota bacterium B1221]|nr:LacI family DNA-binding transcriptional regulator [Kiritimatiellaeota bacterium B1221]